MRRNCLSSLAFVIGFVLIIQSGCQQHAKTPEQSKDATLASDSGIDEQEPEILTTAPAAKIKFEKLSHDFGEVGTRRKYTGEFIYTNNGDGPLKITEVKKCCGVVTTLSKDELAPGESGILKVQYTSGRTSGVIRRQLDVSSNDKANPKVTLTLKAKIVPKVTYEPQKIKLVLNEENASCPDITINCLDMKPFSIKSFQSTGASITADIDPSVEATRFVLQPKIDYQKLESRSAGFVSIRLTHPDCDRIDIYFSTLLRFEITPRGIIVLNPEPQKPTIKKLSIASNYGEDFEIESTSSQNGYAKVLSQQKSAKGYHLEVEVTPPPPDDTGKATDMLYLQLKDDEKLAVKCYVRYLNE